MVSLKIISFFLHKIAKYVYYFFLLLGSLLILCPLVLYLIDAEGMDSDICLDTGWCKEGYVFDNCPPDGRSCVINKETCEKDGGQWYADRKICNTRP